MEPRRDGLTLYNFRAERPVPGWPPDPARATDAHDIQAAQAARAPPPAWGRPTCKDWWEHPERGLRAKLLALYDPQDIAVYKAAFAGARNEKDLENYLVMDQTQSVLDGSPAARSDVFGSSVSTSFLARTAADVGIGLEKFFMVPQMTAVKASLDMIKAFVLMGLYLMLPAALMVSGFRIERLFQITVAILAINFFAVLWHLAWVLENSLIKALWPQLEGYYDRERLLLSSETIFKKNVLEYLLPWLYLVLPGVFMAVLGWAGLHGLSQASSLVSQLAAPLAQAGRAGAQVVYQVIVSAGYRVLTTPRPSPKPYVWVSPQPALPPPSPPALPGRPPVKALPPAGGGGGQKPPGSGFRPRRPRRRP